MIPSNETILAGRMNAVNREFVYIDFDDERFPPCEGGSDWGNERVREGAEAQGGEGTGGNVIVWIVISLLFFAKRDTLTRLTKSQAKQKCPSGLQLLTCTQVAHMSACFSFIFAHLSWTILFNLLWLKLLLVPYWTRHYKRRFHELPGGPPEDLLGNPSILKR